jgi:MFS family permease
MSRQESTPTQRVAGRRRCEEGAALSSPPRGAEGGANDADGRPPPKQTRSGFYDAYTVHHHARAVMGQGVVAAVFLLNEYVARKGLGASRWHVLALLLIPSLAQFVAATANPLDPRRPLGRAPFRAVGIPSRLLLLAFLVLPFLRFDTAFVAIVAMSLFVEALMLPIQNWTLAANYTHSTRGRRFGTTTGLMALAIIAVVLPAGWVLDHDPEAWPWFYALAAVAGVYGYLHWSRLRRRWRRMQREEPEHASPWATLRGDKEFLAFEIGFMVYGLGFLMLQPVLPIYLVDELRVSYADVGMARGLLFWAGMCIASPFMGRLADRIGIYRTCALSFAALTLFPLALLVLPGKSALLVGYLIYGLAMGGVIVAWNLGPIAIARGRDPLPFLNAHVALVAFRALVGMTAGAGIQAVFGARPVFWIVIGLEVIAAVVMMRVARRAWRPMAEPLGIEPVRPLGEG